MVGFTTDHRGLIFSVRRGAKSGGYVINVDAAVIEAIDELKAQLAEEGASDRDALSVNRPQSALTVREVQARLRGGRTVDQVAREAGVEPAWIERFAAPVLAEQAEVIRAARATHMTKHRNDLSIATLGDAVYRNIADRGVTDPRDELDKAWRARQLTEGMWLVTFTYPGRGRDNKAQWEYDEANRVVRARGRLGGVIGWRDGPRRAPTRRKKTATRTATKKAATRPAKKAAKKTAKKTVKKAATRTAKRTTTRTVKKAATREATARKATKKRPAATSAPAKKAAAPGRTTAPKAVAAAPAIARQSPSRRAARQVAALRRAAEARLAAEAEKATRRDIAAVRKAAGRPIVIPPRLVPPLIVHPLFGEEQLDEHDAVDPSLELQWDDSAIEQLDGVEPDREQPEPEEDVTPDQEPEDLEPEDLDPEDQEPEDPEPEDPEPEPEPEPELVKVPEPPRRREPLRARPPDEQAAGNGPVFRDDLAPPAADVDSMPAVGQSADVPLSMPLEPIERPPRRRRLRPLRGR